MTPSKLVAALGAIALLAACEARIGNDKAGGDTAATETSVKAGAEEGQLSIDAPGFEMTLDIPDALAERADLDSDSGILYPGATLSGMHVEARDRGAGGTSLVELRFTSTDAPAAIAAWYRDPARAADFAVTSASGAGGSFAIAGTQKEDGDPFELSLSPRAGGGTDGRLRLRDRG